MPTSIGFVDPRTERDELLWPERFPPEIQAMRLLEMGSRGVAAQDQQRPVPAGGGLFKRSYVEFWEVFPRGNVTFIQSWDCAFKDLDDSDYVVGQVWATKQGQYYLVDQIRDKLSVSATCRAIESLSAKWPRARVKLIEDKANGPAVIQLLKKKLAGLKAINPQGGKWVRANAVEPLWESGNVFLPTPGPQYPWIEEFIAEYVSFSGMDGAEDDQVDAMTQALNYLYNRSMANYRKAMQQIR